MFVQANKKCEYNSQTLYIADVQVLAILAFGM